MEMNRNELDASPNYSSLVYTTDFATRSIQQPERIFSEQELAELIREFFKKLSWGCKNYFQVPS